MDVLVLRTLTFGFVPRHELGNVKVFVSFTHLT